jgi:uncharacterized YigZ family protein
MIEEYRIVSAQAEYEGAKIKGSRFIAWATPATSPAEAEALVSAARRAHPHATHHCLAYRLGPEGKDFHADDDGEPSGSAGRPILQQIESHGLVDTAVVVIRYFGGTKLGVGGLIRAYGGAASEVLKLAPTRTVTVTRRVRVTYPYAVSAAVDAVVATSGLAPAASAYEETVTLEFEVPLARVETFRELIRDRTGGKAETADLG